MDQKFAQIDQRFAEIDQRFERIEALIRQMAAELPERIFGFAQAAKKGSD